MKFRLFQRARSGLARSAHIESLERRTLLSAGDLDLSFGEEGAVFGPGGSAEAMAIDGLGRIIVGGGARLARFNPDGTLDPSFRGNGIAQTKVRIHGIAVHPNGRIIVAGARGGHFAITAHKPNGKIARKFGVIMSDFGGGMGSKKFDGAFDVAIQDDGKIVAVGSAKAAPKMKHVEFAVARYHPNGELDESFGRGGVVTTDIGPGLDRAYAVALQEDGKIVAGGFADFPFENELALVRYNADGSLDESFAEGGVRLEHTGQNEQIYGLGIQSDGRIVATGFSDSFADSFLARFTAEGELDSTFAAGGVISNIFGVENTLAWDLAVQPDDRIVVAGSAGESALVWRYEPDGLADQSFGESGSVAGDFGLFAEARAVVLDADGKIVISGGRGDEILVARYEGAGAPESDGSFMPG